MPKPPDATDLPPLLLGTEWGTAFDIASHEILERDYLPQHLATRRWFAAKARHLSTVRIRDHAMVRGGHEPVFVTLLDVGYADGGVETYFVPMAFLADQEAENLLKESPELVIARVSGARKGVLHERLDWGVGANCSSRSSPGSRAWRHVTGGLSPRPPAPSRSSRGRPPGRPRRHPFVERAEQHVVPVRRPADHEADPAHRAGPQPRARNRLSPDRAGRLPAVAPPGRRHRVRGCRRAIGAGRPARPGPSPGERLEPGAR